MADLKLIPQRSAVEVAPHFRPPTDGIDPPRPGQTAAAYLDQLRAGGHAPDAVAFLAAALPRREAVWWASRCIRAVAESDPAPPTRDALLAAEAWAAAPGDINRRKALTAAEQAGFGDPAGCVALAAFLSGGSLTPVNVKDVPPPDHAFPKALVGALQLAAVAAGPPRLAETHQHFVELGLTVARGDNRWPPSL